jgi:hypothetical protein
VSRARRTLRVLAALLVSAGLFGSSACLFAPQLEPYGYTTCETDADCPAGRDCQVGLCAPPPWMDFDYQQRRPLIVTNPSSEQTLAAGTAVPITIGEGGLFPVEELGADARFVTYDRAADPDGERGAGWTDVPVFREIRADRLLQWMAVPTDVPPQSDGVLAWLYRDRLDGEVGLVEDATRVFERYEVFENADFGLDASAWRIDGTGDATTEAGRIVLRDNTQLFALDRLTPPFAVTLTGTIIGELCDALFIGVQGDDFVGSVPPYAGFFFRQDLEVGLDVIPTADSQPAPVTYETIDAPTALHRYTIEVNEGRVRLSVDEQPFAERADLVPPMTDEELVLSVDVDGAGCVFELNKVWVTRPPFDTPSVSAGEAVDLVFIDDQDEE